MLCKDAVECAGKILHCYVEGNSGLNQIYNLFTYLPHITVYFCTYVLKSHDFRSLATGDGIGQDKGRHKTEISNVRHCPV